MIKIDGPDLPRPWDPVDPDDDDAEVLEFSDYAM